MKICFGDLMENLMQRAQSFLICCGANKSRLVSKTSLDIFKIFFA